MRLQTVDLKNPEFTGTVDCFKKTLFQEGPLAFYKGSLFPLLGTGFMNSIQFASFNLTKRFLTNVYNMEDGFYCSMLSGMSSGIFLSTVMAPVDHCRIRMQI